MTTCVWCGEELKFIQGKGWVHLNGELYKTKIKKTERHPEGEVVDDHCALPKMS